MAAKNNKYLRESDRKKRKNLPPLPRSKKTAAKKSKTARKKRPRKAATRQPQLKGLDHSVEQFRESLERSVTLSRDRLQEVVDDAVKRGRMTRGDAEKMISDLVNRGRRQTDSLLKELERLVKQARREVGGRPSRCATGHPGSTPRAQETGGEPGHGENPAARRHRGEQLEVEIDSLAFGGRGVARADGSSSSSPARCRVTVCGPR